MREILDIFGNESKVKKMSRRTVRKEMSVLVEQYKRSGSSRTTFAIEHGISISKLSYWVNFFNKGRRDESAPVGSFVPVKENRFAGRFRIRLPNGVVIESEEMPLHLVERLMNYVGE